MLYTITVLLVVMWLLGFGFHVLGDWIHILLLLAVASVLINIIQGRRAL